MASNNTEMHEADGRGRRWELFVDKAYYDMWCVRWMGDRKFNSPTSFHFVDEASAVQFLRLIKDSK